MLFDIKVSIKTKDIFKMNGSFLLIIIIGILGMLVQSRLKNKFKKYSHLHLQNGMSGREIAEKMLADNGIYDVERTGTGTG